MKKRRRCGVSLPLRAMHCAALHLAQLASRFTAAVALKGAGGASTRRAAVAHTRCARARGEGRSSGTESNCRWPSWYARDASTSTTVCNASKYYPPAGDSSSGGGGFLPDSKPSYPPPTQKRQGPRPVKKRFNGEDALDARALKDRRQNEGQRLSKALAQLGVASRRASEDLIFAGRVQVNGVTVTVPQHAVSTSRDVISVDGKVVQGGVESLGEAGHLYFLLHKPKGYLCSNKAAGAGARARDQDKLVLDLFDDWREGWKKKHKNKLPPRLFTVGRLDVNTTGMLLVTTDGQWCERVAHPSSEIAKSYIVTASTRPTKAQIKKMGEGCEVDGVHVTPLRVETMEGARDGGPANRVLVDVVDGRNREVRVLSANAGVDVKKLKRVRVGGLRMPSELPIGKYMTLKPHQVGYVLDRGLAMNSKAAESSGGMMGKMY